MPAIEIGEVITLRKFRLGTTQPVQVIIDENGYHQFYLLGKHLGKVPFTKEHYGTLRKQVKKFAHNLKEGQIVECKVLGINRKKHWLILKLQIT